MVPILFACISIGLETMCILDIWRYQRVNQNPYIEEEQTTQWTKKKVQGDKQRSTKHTYKTEDWVTRNPLKIGGELRCSGRVGKYYQIFAIEKHIVQWSNDNLPL